MKIVSLWVIFFTCSFSLLAESLPCDQSTWNHQPFEELWKNVQNAVYQEVATLKVKWDGEGKISVYAEKGVPKLIKFTYKNADGEEIIVKSIEELERGEKMMYEDPKVKGSAIILQKGNQFKLGTKLNFNLLVRSSVSPEKHNSYSITLDSGTPLSLTYQTMPIKTITLTPGVGLTGWNGTFSKVQLN